MTKTSTFSHAAALTFLVACSTLLGGCQASADASADLASSTARAESRSMPPIRFFGDDLPEAYAVPVAETLELASVQPKHDRQ